MMAPLRTVLVALGAASVFAADLIAQDAPRCAYDECALMIKNRFFGWSIVRGVREERAASVVLIAPDLTPLVGGSDSAASYVRRFRTRYNGGQGIAVASLALLVFAGLSTESDIDLRRGLSVAGFVGLAVGMMTVASSMNDLRRGIRTYNGTLDR